MRHPWEGAGKYVGPRRPTSSRAYGVIGDPDTLASMDDGAGALGPEAVPARSLEAGGRRFTVDRATESDVSDLVALLADDVLGAGREVHGLDPYLLAFREIADDPHQYLAAVRDVDGRLVGTMQLTLIPGLARGGAKRLHIEAVRLASDTRGTGLGTALFEWAHAFGRLHGATLAQLTSDKTRSNALRFYGRLGYQASHEGFKRPL